MICVTGDNLNHIKKMTALEIKLNDKIISTVGITGVGSLNSIITLLRKEDNHEYVRLIVGGSSSSEKKSFDWVDEDLKMGDNVTITITSTDNITRPVKETSEKEIDDIVIQQKIKTFHRLKEELKGHIDT